MPTVPTTPTVATMPAAPAFSLDPGPPLRAGHHTAIAAERATRLSREAGARSHRPPSGAHRHEVGGLLCDHRRVYVPPPNAMPAADVEAFLAAHPAGRLVTVGPDARPDVTLLPVVVTGSTVLAHFARANEHWRRIGARSPGLLVVGGADAYVSPGWYAAKAEHGRVVPTWNYTEVQVRGSVTVHDDPEWVLDVVTRLTDRHERGRARPWAVTDAPDTYVRGQLRAIVGVELVIEEATGLQSFHAGVEGKAKLSQNRSDADRRGVIAGLRAEGNPTAYAIADEMDRALRE
jgi:transcriptional regulator